MLRRTVAGIDPACVNPESVTGWLEDAGRTLLALPHAGPSTRLVQSGMEWVRDASEAYGRERARLRPAVPSAAQITRMDQALGWVALIPPDKCVVRRIVGARSLVNPMNDRHLFTWRRLGLALGADHKAVQRWHAQGIALIVAGLRRPPAPSQARTAPPPCRSRPVITAAPKPDSVKAATQRACSPSIVP